MASSEVSQSASRFTQILTALHHVVRIAGSPQMAAILA